MYVCICEYLYIYIYNLGGLIGSAKRRPGKASGFGLVTGGMGTAENCHGKCCCVWVCVSMAFGCCLWDCPAREIEEVWVFR